MGGGGAGAGAGAAPSRTDLTVAAVELSCVRACAQLCVRLWAAGRDAMAMVHSRVRRVVYGAPDAERGALGSCLSLHQVPQLNHHYEARGRNRTPPPPPPRPAPPPPPAPCQHLSPASSAPLTHSVHTAACAPWAQRSSARSVWWIRALAHLSLIARRPSHNAAGVQGGASGPVLMAV
jgi:hypothetical protein